MSQSPDAGLAIAGGLRDRRVLVGVAITILTLWYALRGVDFATLGREIARADLLVLTLSVPVYLGILYLRALRWGHLTDAVQPMGRGLLFRAMAVGFMANNLFPLRIGEVVRAWYLARQTSASMAALFGTVIVERLIDIAVVAALAAAVFAFQKPEFSGVDPMVVFPALLAVSAVPVACVAALRLAPGPAIELGSRLSGRVLPARLNLRLVKLLHQLAEGLGGLRGGRHLVWIALHSALLWLVLSPAAFLVGLWSLGIDLGSPGRTLSAAYAIQVWVGAAVALPSAPGFFGPYHAACWLALRPFEVPKEVAVALGTVCHASFWIVVTAIGLGVLRVSGSKLRAARAR